MAGRTIFGEKMLLDGKGGEGYSFKVFPLLVLAKGPLMARLCRFATIALVASMLTSFALPNAHAVTIDWVTVGDPGNTADTTGYGAVAD